MMTRIFINGWERKKSCWTHDTSDKLVDVYEPDEAGYALCEVDAVETVDTVLISFPLAVFANLLEVYGCTVIWPEDK